MTYDIVETTTHAIKFQLLEDLVPIDVTGCTVTLLLTDRTGTTVASPGTVTVTDATIGIVQLAPTDATVFIATAGPYYARWKILDGSSKVSFVPTSNKDVWNIVGI